MLRILFSEPKNAAKGPAIFIDRDGVINERRPGDYVLDWSQFVFVPGIRKALSQLATLGLPLIVISNQAAVGKGMLDLEGLREITSRMQQVLLRDGTPLSAVYYCPHRSEENCRCRKPSPGLLTAVAQDFNIDLARSVFIGDSVSDVEAAQAVGARPLVFGTGLDMMRSELPVAELTIVRAAEELFDRVRERLSAETLRFEANQRPRT